MSRSRTLKTQRVTNQKIFVDTIPILDAAFPRLRSTAEKVDMAVRTNPFVRAEAGLNKFDESLTKRIIIPRKRNFLRGKKGTLQDVAFKIGAIFFFAMVILLMFKVVSELNNNIQANPNIPQNALDSTNTLEGFYPGILDNAFLFFVIGMCLVSIMFASLVRVHPVFMILFIIGLVMLILVSGAISNAYEEMASVTALQAQADQLVFVSHVMDFLPYIIGVLGFLIMVIMHKLFDTQ